ncbi:NAD(P)H-dependent oxidoreductase [Brevibacillus halotolerans]|uniref:NADPH-dependent FMN reductase n=1 Tax=Brevibacillus TaxID=55080 RepID=UPI00215B94E9|nr:MULTISPECIES: NAD(P)H-dependent oxidoreductase [Brevibacillus]MCR8965011.1 NAD(P)H-dependent oxidoreductase [Brevibacillus laterosporus]MCZ0837166.1 NAD(P)H-dependent oxidoreductase [Brevibacillus halotolerans]
MKIVGIAGSMNVESSTKKVMQIVLDSAKMEGAEVELIHLAEWPLPLYDARNDASTYPEIVHQFVKKVAEADALVAGSPEYHGTITGALKNSFDFLEGRFLQGKPVAIIGVAGGSMGATNTVNTLQLIFRNLHAYPLPGSPSVSNSYKAFTEDNTLQDERLQERFVNLGKELVWMTKKLK